LIVAQLICGQQRHARPSRALGWHPLRERLTSRRQRLGQQRQHGLDLRGQQALNEAAQAAHRRCRAEAAGVGQRLAHQRARQPVHRAAFACGLGVCPIRHQQLAVFHAGRTGGHAPKAAQAAVDVGRGVFGLDLALQHVLHQHNSSARRVHFLAEQLVGRADRQAETAVHAHADGLGHRFAARANLVNRDHMLHRMSSHFENRAIPALRSAAVEDIGPLAHRPGGVRLVFCCADWWAT
jgi:hypothetical protein